MRSKEIDDRITEIRTEIGVLKLNRNLTACCAGTWTLCLGVNLANTIINPSPSFIVLLGLNAANIGIYSYLAYKRQQRINALRLEEQSLLSDDNMPIIR